MSSPLDQNAPLSVAKSTTDDCLLLLGEATSTSTANSAMKRQLSSETAAHPATAMADITSSMAGNGNHQHQQQQLFSSPSLPSKKKPKMVTVTAYKKVEVPELFSPVTQLDIENNFELKGSLNSNINNGNYKSSPSSRQCPDGNVLQKVASLTAENFTLKTLGGLSVINTMAGDAAKQSSAPKKMNEHGGKVDQKVQTDGERMKVCKESQTDALQAAVSFSDVAVQTEEWAGQMPATTTSSAAPVPPPPPPPPGSLGPVVNSAPAPPPPPPPPGSLGPLIVPPPPPPPPPPPGMGGPPPPPPPPSTGMPPPPPPPSFSTSGPQAFPAPLSGGWNAQYTTCRKPVVTPKVLMKPLFWSRIQIPSKVVVPPPLPQLINPATTSDSTTVDGSVAGGKQSTGAGNAPTTIIPFAGAAANQQQPSPSSPPPCSIWEFLEEKDDVINDEFFTLFARQEPTTFLKKPSDKMSSASGQKKVETGQLLEQKRAHNVGILITSLRLDVAVIEGALLNFNIETVVGTEKLQQIHEMAATAEELLTIEGHLKRSPEVPLGKTERFLYDLSRIPQFHERINCIMHELRFEELLVDIESTLSNFKLTCSSFTSKSCIKEIFAMILTVGNYMNGGNRDRGQADGFGLEILNKLKDVKGKENGSNLLEYVVKVYIRQYYPEVNSMENVAFPLVEPANIEKCSTVVFSDIEAKLAELSKIIRQTNGLVTSVLAKGEKDEESGEYVEHIRLFKEKMDAFLGKATKQMNEQEENLKDCKRKFNDTMKFFAYCTKSRNENEWPKEFFGHWIQFTYDFELIFNQELQRAIKQNFQPKQPFRAKADIKVRPMLPAGLKEHIKSLTKKDTN